MLILSPERRIGYRLDRSLPEPKILYDNCDRYGGFYQDPCDDYENGLIVVSTVFSLPIADEESTIVHEYRHHYQLYNGPTKRNSVIWGTLDYESNYEKCIKKYFLCNEKELDALLYQHSSARTDLTDYWMNLIGLHKERRIYG